MDKTSELFERLKEEREDAKRKREDATSDAKAAFDAYRNYGNFAGLTVESKMGSVKADVDYEPKLIEVDIPIKTEVRDVFEAGELAKMDAEATEGRFGMNYMGGGAALHETAMDVAKSWGISSDGVPEGKMDALADSFLLAMRDRFMERYETMLSCVTSLKMYAEFKGVPYSRIANKIYGGKGKGLDVVEIGGTKFILIKRDDFREWHKFLAEKGVKMYADHEDDGKAAHYAQVYHACGGDEVKALEMLHYDSVKEFLGLYEGGVKPDGGRGKPKTKGHFFDAMRGSLSNTYAYSLYSRWAKDLQKIEPVTKRVFVRRVGDMGFLAFNKKGERGFYFYRVDEKPIGTDDGQLKIPRRGSYPRSKGIQPWEKFDELGGEIKK